MPARNGCTEFTPEMAQPPASPVPLPICKTQRQSRTFATRKADTDFLDVRQVFHPSVARSLTYKRLQRYLRFFGRSPLISDAARKFL